MTLEEYRAIVPRHQWPSVMCHRCAWRYHDMSYDSAELLARFKEAWTDHIRQAHPEHADEDFAAVRRLNLDRPSAPTTPRPSKP